MVDSLMNGIFSDAVKIAVVSRIDKKCDDKNKISDYRPVSVFNIFTKVYEIVPKNALVSALENTCLPLFRPIERGIALNMFL